LPPDPGFRFVQGVGSAADDLSAFNNSISAGDQYLASGVTDGNVLGEFSSAVRAFKAGAGAAVSSVGPAINAQTNGASASLVQQAANVFTTQLSPIAVGGASQQDALNASLYAHQMQALYTTAIAMPSGPTTAPTVPPVTTRPGPGPTLAPTATPSGGGGGGGNVLPWVLGGVAVAGVGVVGWMMYRRAAPARRLAA
jgi:hypothetical protein